MTLTKIFYILFHVKIAILDSIEEVVDRALIVFHAHIKDHEIRCACCRSKNVRKEASQTRRFRGCNLGDKKTYLELVTYKLYCRECNKRAWMSLPFAMGKLPMTATFINYIISLCRISTLLHVANLLCLEWKTIKNIHKAHLKKRPKQFSYRKLRYISIDEIAIRKGHVYMTIVTDLTTGQIIHAIKGRKEEVLSPFFRQLAKKAKHLRGIAMDMSKGYIALAKKYLPAAAIVFDRFHVTKVLTTMVDEVRKKEWKRHQMEGISIGKGERFLFLRNRENLSPLQGKGLDLLLEMNKSLMTAYVMKEQFRCFWECKTREEATRFLISWIVDANWCGIEEVRKAAQTILGHSYGLLNYFDHPIDNGKAEGINNKIKTMKRQSYGCRDEDYFIFKLYNLHKSKSILVGIAA
jgi:transposase